MFKIFEKSDRAYLHNTSVRGALNGEKNAIDYSPLHGCVMNPEKGYIFSKTKIASAYSDQRDDWNNLRNTISNVPILFWGWSFEDSDAIEAIYSNNSGVNKNTDKWIVLYDPTEEEILFYEALNFNIIISDTLQMLKYIDTHLVAKEKEDNISISLPEYSAPNDSSSLASYPLTSFFEGDAPKWSHIYSGEIAKTHHFSIIKNDINSGKNVFIIGIPASGKTTLFMQLIAEYNTKRPKHFLIGPSLEEAKIYVKKIKSEKVILFIDDCFSDVDAIGYLLSKDNIQLIGFDRDYLYEAISYKLRPIDVSYITRDITDINDVDKRLILDSIPNDRKHSKTTINTDSTIFSLLLKNLKGQRFEIKFRRMVGEFYVTNPIATELFVMICYVHACGVPVSFDMIYSYLRDFETDYMKIYDLIEQVGNIIKDCSDGTDKTFDFLNVHFDEQDYYQSRSKYFAELIIKNIPGNCDVFKEVLFKFVRNVPSFKICRYDVFKRKGYDAEFTSKAFLDVNDGINFYTLASEKDETEYLYQQAALYFCRKKQYTLAFRWIDKARNITAYNKFSIDNTHAIIQFNANKDVEDVDGSVKRLLMDSLDVLRKCYENDRRKPTHLKYFVQLTIEFYNRYGYYFSQEYLQFANEWLEKERETLDCGNRLKRELEDLYEKLKKIIEV